MKEINLDVKKVGNVWRIINTDTSPPSPMLQATIGDTLIWSSRKKLAFQFPTDISDQLKPVRGKDDFEHDCLKTLPAGDKLKLEVKQGARRAQVIQYAVFVVDEGEFAQGQSPPIIIIY